ncbi:MAG TPA: polyhydroxyalkanoic acid system family protein [Bryobacteraceae bacterium]|nr:polyhydroxyalkanoic acid system family protein [Bryobacteraceae bacterium]
MRVTVSHNKTRQEAMKAVDDATADLLRALATGPVQIVDQKKNWQGNVMHFTVKGRMAVFSATVVGTIEVTDKEIIIEADLPALLTKVLPEEKIRAGIETKVKGLLT